MNKSIRVLGGHLKKPIYRERLTKRGGGLGQFVGSRRGEGAWQERGDGVFQARG